jgi:5-methylthioadenosine/S-adenosylhomocysteine deaminase
MTSILYQADYIVTMDRYNTIIKNGAVLVDQGKIVQLGKASELLAQHASVPLKNMPDRILMPGLINTHCHSGMLRGTAEGLAAIY